MTQQTYGEWMRSNPPLPNLTSVEWLSFQIMDNWSEIHNGNKLIDEFIEQAKAMEKEQMKKAVMRSVTTWHPLRRLFEKQFEEYYNETYNK